MNTNRKTEDTPKRTYEKPSLRKIDLAAEEIMAVGCKLSAGGSAPLGSPCTLNNCSSPGS